MPIFRLLFSRNCLLAFAPNVNRRRLVHLSAKFRRISEKSSRSGYFSFSIKQKEIDEKNEMRKLLTSSNTAPGEVYLQVIQSGCVGQEKCLYLFTSYKRYIFNCPENFCRIIKTATNVRVNDLENVFITRNVWANIGGLLGFSMSKRDAVVNSVLNVGAAEGSTPDVVSIHGPSDVMAIFRATKFFYEENPPFNMVEKPCTTSGMYEDECLSMKYIPLKGQPKKRACLNENGEYQLTPEDDACVDMSIAYICKLTPKPGRLLIERCRKEGVPFGPLLGELQKGNDITLPDGKVVRSADMLGPAEPSTSFAVVDIADEHLLNSLLLSTEFDEYFEGGVGENRLNVVVHFTDEKIYQSDVYQSWMKKFGADVRHLVMNTLAPLMPHNEAVFRTHTQLNFVNSTLFPLLATQKTRKPENVIDLVADHVVFAEPFMKYNLRPHNEFERDPTLEFDAEKALNVLKDVEGFDAVCEKYHREIGKQETTTQKFPEVLFTGTGSASPGKIRNVSGILLNMNFNQSMILDCGEGTYGQLMEYYGLDECDRILCNLKLIYISHMHPDHHAGLFSLMLKRHEAFERRKLNFEPIYIIGAPELFQIHSAYSSIVEDVLPHAKRVFSYPNNQFTQMKLAEIKRRLNLNFLSLTRVHHPRYAYGLVMRLGDNTKIVYSGDTRPCEALIEAGRDADLLIHEATFEDDLIGEAESKKHSTVTEALKVAEKMRAKRTILTHFSARYSRLPLVDEKMLQGKVGVAFDFLRLSLAEFDALPKVFPILKTAFSEYYVNDFERSKKRIDNRERFVDDEPVKSSSQLNINKVEKKRKCEQSKSRIEKVKKAQIS